MTDFKKYKDLHAGRDFLVVGCGESATLAKGCGVLTVGVNDISRLLTPDYLVVVNSLASFGDRWKWIAETECQHVFTHLKALPIPSAKRVLFHLGRHGGVNMDGFKVPYTSNSPYLAVVLASYMGAGRIGLLGVDFTDHHFFAKTGEHKLTPKLRAINAQYGKLASSLATRGIGFYNLSPTSKLTAIRKMDIQEFTNKN